MSAAGGLMDFDESDPLPDAVPVAAVPVAMELVAAIADAAQVDDDVPPAGTACVGCRGLGHWCQAKCYRGMETPMCWACAEGVDCEVTLRRLRRVEADWMPEMERESSATSAVRDVTPVDAAKRVVVDRPPGSLMPYRVRAGAIRIKQLKQPEMVRERYPALPAGTERRVREAATAARRAAVMPEPEVEAAIEVAKEEEVMPIGVRTAVSAEQIEAIKAAPATMGHKELGLKLGLDRQFVDRKRRELGIAVALRRGKPRAEGKDAGKRGRPAGGVVLSGVVDIGARDANLKQALDVGPRDAKGLVTLSIAQERLNAWWGKLPVERKLALLLAEVGL
jgi:hypothetical protein